ncbi:MAG: DUF3089 domain-containing protein [Chitinophagales bacterium]|nr:DUF3089 domain-containing protein [Chitinophagales bacterium]MCB9020263.1 DUF3089 domain-containing protein [Chitinophagales bacterium]MCB9031553.1 DUF3089 domain-containing protein [Chitinophagales bacterium]
MKRTIFLLLSTALLLQACGYTKAVKVAWDPANNPPIPDYSDSTAWAALPDMKDSADHIPAMGLIDIQYTARADVFFIHPTSYFTRKHWNADIHDEKVNDHTDEGTITHQASVFNGSCRVFAPRYRQTTYQAFFSLDNPEATEAFKLAYGDVKAAFQYYLSHYNNGRPIIIASHSQGTVMAVWLLQEFFDGTPLQKQLVAAYITGMPVYNDDFTFIPVCDSASQQQCYVSWRSFLYGHEPPEKYQIRNRENVVVVNPLTWTTDTGFVAPVHNIGGLGKNAETIYPQVCGTEIHGDLLWVTKPDIPGKALLWMKNYHRADYNLYWMNIRDNVAVKVNRYLEEHH